MAACATTSEKRSPDRHVPALPVGIHLARSRRRIRGGRSKPVHGICLSKGRTMATITAMHRTASRDEWLKERLELLKAEKELTRQSDELARRRQALPWVKVEKDYRFETDEGPATLAELFRGRSQL